MVEAAGVGLFRRADGESVTHNEETPEEPDHIKNPVTGTKEEYAALVEHIIENTMLYGEVIRLDGALRMGAK